MESYKKKESKEVEKYGLHEGASQHTTSKNEEDRLREAIFASDMDKFRLFTRMLRTNALFKRATVTHKK